MKYFPTYKGDHFFQDPDGSECAQPNYQSENAEEENEENWKQTIRDITDERDQALKERNQALAALMELEKEHAEAIRTIERLKAENLSNRFVENSPKTPTGTTKTGGELSTNHCDASSVGNLLQKLGDVKRDGKRDTKHEGFAASNQKVDRNHEQADYSFWKEVVTQAKEERDFLLKRLEIVKSERNSYLERLHSLEKDNQRLRDAVSVRRSELPKNRLLDDISRHFHTDCRGENNAREALSSVLAQMKSKR